MNLSAVRLITALLFLLWGPGTTLAQAMVDEAPASRSSKFVSYRYGAFDYRELLIERQQTDLLVIHHTAIEQITTQQIHDLHLHNGWAGIGYHMVIDTDGNVFEGRPEQMIGAHAYGYNQTSIGIVLVGDFNQHPPTDEQLERLLEVSVALMDKYHIPLERVVPHRQLCATDCPGRLFPWQEYIVRLASLADVARGQAWSSRHSN